ncbi:MAG: hypothetical protein SYC29_13635 [Planctomycetota bacterium]|nr:hypothetical protein [Planctomycetota bacterium]
MNPSGDKPLELSPDDRRVVDALFASGFDEEAARRLPASDRARAERLTHLLELMHDYPVEDADETLTHVTLAGIDRYEAERAKRMTIDPMEARDLRARRLRRVPLPSLVTVAATILIGASIILPILHNLRQQQVDMKRLNNLRYVSFAVDNYAADYDGAIPTARAGLSGAPAAFADAINLTPLIEERYCRINEPQPEEYESSPAGVWFGSNRVLFLGDRNPIIEALRRQQRLDRPLVITFGHDQARRNILTAEGAILWLGQPQRRAEAPPLWRPRGVLWLADDIHPRSPER